MSRSRSALPALALLLAGCSALEAFIGQPPPSPIPCEQQHSQDRCERMAEAIFAPDPLDPDSIVSIEILPTPRPPDGVLTTSGGGRRYDIVVTLEDGTQRSGGVCGGADTSPACVDDPRLVARSITDGGYFDIPCPGDPDTGTQVCPSPVPEPGGAAIDAAEQISIDALSIPIDHLGMYEVVVGTGSLPDGYLRSAGFAFAEPWPDDLRLLDGTATIQVRSLEPGGRAFDNVYEHGIHDGPERIEAVVLFEVTRFEPGATLDLVDIVVR